MGKGYTFIKFLFHKKHMKRRRQFHCERCGAACEIYKKGKKHRVLVCPTCGVLATNPISGRARGALSGAATGATIGSVVPGLGTGAGAAIGGAIGALTGGGEEAATATTSPQCGTARTTRRNLTPFYINKALGGA